MTSLLPLRITVPGFVAGDSVLPHTMSPLSTGCSNEDLLEFLWVQNSRYRIQRIRLEIRVSSECRNVSRANLRNSIRKSHPFIHTADCGNKLRCFPRIRIRRRRNSGSIRELRKPLVRRFAVCLEDERKQDRIGFAVRDPIRSTDRMCECVNIPVSAVICGGSEIIVTGSRTATSGIKAGSLIPNLSCVFGSDTTAASVTSLPLPAVVGITNSGGIFFPTFKRPRSDLTGFPGRAILAPTTLAQSICEPPPRAINASQFFSR